MRLEIKSSFLASAMLQELPVRETSWAGPPTKRWGVRGDVASGGSISANDSEREHALRAIDGASRRSPPDTNQGVLKMIEMVGMLTMSELMNHQGVHLERLKNLQAPDGSPLYSLRVTKAARALATVNGDTLILRYVESDHGKAY